MNYEYKQGEIKEVKRIINQDKKGKSEYIIECPRCGGHGKLNQFNHVNEGVCFKCNGTGEIKKEGKLYTLDQAKKLKDRYINKALKRIEKYNEECEKEKTEVKKTVEVKHVEKCYSELELDTLIKLLKSSKKNIVKSIIDFYKNNNFITNKQFNTLKNCLTRKQMITYLLKLNDLEDLQYYIDEMTSKQVISYINKVGKENLKGSQKRVIKAHFVDNEMVLSMIK